MYTHNKMTGWVSLVLLIVATFPLGMISRAADAPASDPPTKEVTVLPFASGTDLTQEQAAGAARCAAGLQDAVSEGLGSLPGVTIVEFNRMNPSIQRAITERKLSKEDLAKGVDTSATGAALAQKVAQVLGVETALIGSVDRYEFNETKGSVTITVTLQSIDVRTGKPASTVSASGEGTKAAGEIANEERLADLATKDVLAKIMSGFRGGETERSPATH